MWSQIMTAAVDATLDTVKTGYDIFTNERSWRDYQENNDYNRALQQQIFEREDTAYSRSVNDMMNAGLSPVNANGAGAGSVVSNASAPSMNKLDPSRLLALSREVQNGVLASEESNRQQALAENTINFTGAQIDKMIGDSARADKQLAINAMQQETKMYLDYTLAMEDLKEKGLTRKQNLSIAQMEHSLKKQIFENEKEMQKFNKSLLNRQFDLDVRKQDFFENDSLRKYFLDLDKFQVESYYKGEELEQGYLGMLSSIGQFLLNPLSSLGGSSANLPFSGSSHSSSSSKGKTRKRR